MRAAYLAPSSLWARNGGAMAAIRKAAPRLKQRPLAAERWRFVRIESSRQKVPRPRILRMERSQKIRRAKQSAPVNIAHSRLFARMMQSGKSGIAGGAAI